MPEETKPDAAPHPIHDCTAALLSNYWRWNYYDFCEACSITPGDSYSKEKWEDFMGLVRGLKSFSRENLEKLFTKP